MKREISPAIAGIVIVVMLAAIGLFVWTRPAKVGDGMTEQQFLNWKQKMQAGTPKPGSTAMGQPGGRPALTPGPAPATQ